MSYGHHVSIAISDHMNTVAYPVEMPAYAAVKSAIITDGLIEPFGTPDKNTKVLSRITISAMVDFVDRVIPFKILKQRDILEIYTYLSEYTSQLTKFEHLTEAKEYVEKTRALLVKLKRSVMILSKTDPEAEKLLYQGGVGNMLKQLDRTKKA